MSIRKRRLEKGWSQEELARHSGLSTRTIQRIEAGHNAGHESIKCLAAVFDTSMSTLLQELPKSERKIDHQMGTKHLLKIEHDAIKFAQSILNNSKNGKKLSLSKREKEAINDIKKVVSQFKSSQNNDGK